MALDFDSVFATPARSLALGSQRMEVLAANIANADTPNYLARDIDFKAAMQQAGAASGAMHRTNPRHMAAGGGAGGSAKLMYRLPMQPAEDGNTVESEREKAALSETAVRYQTSLTFLNMRIRGLKLAITGGR